MHRRHSQHYILSRIHRIITNNFLFDDITGTTVFKSDIKNVRINEKVACLKCVYAVRMQAQAFFRAKLI